VTRALDDRSPGRSLELSIRSGPTTNFGSALDRVRIHADETASQLAAALNADAFTRGDHIYFGADKYHPDLETGRRLLLHELTHVVQQAAGMVTGYAGRVVPATHPSEVEAASGALPLRPKRRSGHTLAAIQRQPSGTVLPPSRQLPPGDEPAEGVTWVDLEKIRYYTQTDISFYTRDRDTGEMQSVGRMAAAMRKDGWDISKPVDVVLMPDGRMVSLDHRRLWAAHRAGNVRRVTARVHTSTEKIDHDVTRNRFKIDKGGEPLGTNPRTGVAWKAGDVPDTWGDAVQLRSAAQALSKTARVGNRGYNPRVLPGGQGVRDPTFPPGGSSDPPARLQPGRLDYEPGPYSGGGTVIKSGGTRKTVPSSAVIKGSIGDGGRGSGGGGGARSGRGSVDTRTVTRPTTPSANAPGKATGLRRTDPLATDLTRSAPPKIERTAKPARATAPVAEPQPTRPAVDSRAVQLTAGAATRAISARLGQVNDHLMRVAAQDPEAADAISKMTKVLDAHSAITDPAHFGAQKIADYAMDQAFDALSQKLTDGEAQFFEAYPDIRELHAQRSVNGTSLDELRQRYAEAAGALRIPDARRELFTAFVMADVTEQTPSSEVRHREQIVDAYLATLPGVGDVVNRYFAARNDYAKALGAAEIGLGWRLKQLETLPPDFADEIRRRGERLCEISRDVDEYAKWFAELSAIPGADVGAWLYHRLATGFDALGQGLSAFAEVAGGRKSEYERDLADLEAISTHLNELRGTFDVISPPTRP